MKVTKLKRIFCGKKNSYRELLKIKLVRKKIAHTEAPIFQNHCKMMMRVDTKIENLEGGFDSTRNISRRPDQN
jgi:hypothetical protein